MSWIRSFFFNISPHFSFTTVHAEGVIVGDEIELFQVKCSKLRILNVLRGCLGVIFDHVRHQTTKFSTIVHLYPDCFIKSKRRTGSKSSPCRLHFPAPARRCGSCCTVPTLRPRNDPRWRWGTIWGAMAMPLDPAPQHLTVNFASFWQTITEPLQFCCRNLKRLGKNRFPLF